MNNKTIARRCEVSAYHALLMGSLIVSACVGLVVSMLAAHIPVSATLAQSWLYKMMIVLVFAVTAWEVFVHVCRHLVRAVWFAPTSFAIETVFGSTMVVHPQRVLGLHLHAIGPVVVLHMHTIKGPKGGHRRRYVFLLSAAQMSEEERAVWNAGWDHVQHCWRHHTARFLSPP